MYKHNILRSNAGGEPRHIMATILDKSSLDVCNKTFGYHKNISCISPGFKIGCHMVEHR